MSVQSGMCRKVWDHSERILNQRGEKKWLHGNNGNKGDKLIAYFNSTSFAQLVQENAASMLTK